MIKLITLCIVQSAMSVGGAFLINGVLHEKSASFATYMQAGLSQKGLAGIGLMLASFLVLTYALGHFKPSTLIPINTATTFIATVILGYIIGHDRVSYTAVAGMLLIGSGITLVLRAQ